MLNLENIGDEDRPRAAAPEMMVNNDAETAADQQPRNDVHHNTRDDDLIRR